MYDQQVEITLEKLRQWAELEAQEKQPVYDYGDHQAGNFYFIKKKTQRMMKIRTNPKKKKKNLRLTIYRLKRHRKL